MLVAWAAILAAACTSGETPVQPVDDCPTSLQGVVTVPTPAPATSFRALVFTRTVGYRHASIPDGVRALTALGAATGFAADTSSDPALFTDAGLRPYRVVVFLNTTGDVLDAAQQGALERFVAGGGGWAGVHAAADSEYDWPWYQGLLGARFTNHSAVVAARVVVADASHPSTTGIPSPWNRTDEWYNFQSAPGAPARVLLRVDEASYTGGTMGANHPISWSRSDLGGRVWYTAMGHTSCSYVERQMLSHLRGGILWAAGADSLASRPF